MRPSYQETGVKSFISVWLDNTNRTLIKAFYCVGCGKVVFQYYTDALMMIAGDGPVEDTYSPFIVTQCKNGQCKMLYKIYRG